MKYKIILYKTQPIDKWWHKLAGMSLISDHYDKDLGYRLVDHGMYTGESDVEFYIPGHSIKDVKVLSVLNLGIILLDPECEPERHGDWVDLKCREETFISKGEYKEIPLGIKVDIPEGYEAHILPRSSTFRKYSILMANSKGIVDNTYGEEWHFLAYAIKHTKIPVNVRIAQFRLVKKMPELEIQYIQELPAHKNRKGLGSTGK